MFCSTATTVTLLQNALVRTPSRHPIEVISLSFEWVNRVSKSEKRRRTDLLPSVRCYPEEKAKILKNANAAGLSTGEYMRRCALGRRIVAKGDTKQMNEILKQGGLLKHLYTEMQKQGAMTTELSKEFASTLRAQQVAFLNFEANSHNNDGE